MTTSTGIAASISVLLGNSNASPVKYMKKTAIALSMIIGLAGISFAQPRPVEKASLPSAPKAAPAPETFAAKYEGGLFGYNQKQEGKLKFDDVNERLVFFGKDQKELFSIPYHSLLVIYPQSRSVTSNTGNIVSHIPLPGAFLGGLIKEKRRYLILHFDDPDVDAKGVVNFKLSNKELLDSVIQSLGGKAKLTQRGDAYYRKREQPKTEI
jgi:hypothetical protein